MSLEEGELDCGALGRRQFGEGFCHPPFALRRFHGGIRGSAGRAHAESRFGITALGRVGDPLAARAGAHEVEGAAPRDDGEPGSHTASPGLESSCLTPCLREGVGYHLFRIARLADDAIGYRVHHPAIPVVHQADGTLVPARGAPQQLGVARGFPVPGHRGTGIWI